MQCVLFFPLSFYGVSLNQFLELLSRTHGLINKRSQQSAVNEMDYPTNISIEYNLLSPPPDRTKPLRAPVGIIPIYTPSDDGCLKMNRSLTLHIWKWSWNLSLMALIYFALCIRCEVHAVQDSTQDSQLLSEYIRLRNRHCFDEKM